MPTGVGRGGGGGVTPQASAAGRRRGGRTRAGRAGQSGRVEVGGTGGAPPTPRRGGLLGGRVAAMGSRVGRTQAERDKAFVVLPRCLVGHTSHLEGAQCLNERFHRWSPVVVDAV